MSYLPSLFIQYISLLFRYLSPLSSLISHFHLSSSKKPLHMKETPISAASCSLMFSFIFKSVT
ncbi:hypothetical protein Hdeb2414_s0006g00207621 [Helianthus debilis subsp. tardiflorus]